MRDVYDLAERVPDTQWLADIGDANWVGVTQNFKIAQVLSERTAIEEHGTRVYSLSRANYPVLSQGLLLGRNIVRMLRQGSSQDPRFWRISHGGVLRDI